MAKAANPAETNRTTDPMLHVLRDCMVSQVAKAGLDLTQRQQAVMLVCMVDRRSQTVRGLSTTLSVSKPAISRALDRLEKEGMVARKADPDDRRSVTVEMTRKGVATMRQIGDQMNQSLQQRGYAELVPAG